jgi:DnaJ-class molecular chaperone
MPQSNPNAPICRDCDGFASVAIDTGTRHLDGTRVTLRVDCPTCKGTGHITPASALARVGR